MYQAPLPDKYQQMTEQDMFASIIQRKTELGDRLVILGHHYQRDEIIQFADYSGDSLELSRIASQQHDAQYIVFCGVHFMAESADILTGPDQKVLLPDMTAGCSMADMAEIDQVEDCWQFLQENMRQADKLVPVTYVNSTADVKAFCGSRGGYCCTSSNCRAIFEHIWREDDNSIILFLPDEHLGRNTAYAMGHVLETLPLWDPFMPGGGIEPDQLAQSRVILWKGFCSVHQGFTVEQIEEAKQHDRQVKVIVHPECCFEVVQAADEVGSTAFICKTIRAAEPGSCWAVGTEINLVNRLAEEMAAHKVKVRSLSGIACLCETMYRIDPRHLLWLLDTIAQHEAAPEKTPLLNRIVVDEDTKRDARKALERMLAITAAKKA